MMVAPAAIQTLLSITMGFADGDGAALRRFKRMARRDQAHIRPDHHIVCDVEPAEVVERAVLIDEDITPDADFVAAGGIERRDQQKAVVDFFADEFAEQGADFVRIVEGQTIESGGDRHRPFDVRQHGRRFRRSAVDYSGAGLVRHSLFSLGSLSVRFGAPDEVLLGSSIRSQRSSRTHECGLSLRRLV